MCQESVKLGFYKTLLWVEGYTISFCILINLKKSKY